MFKIVAFATLALATNNPAQQCRIRPTETVNVYDITTVQEASPLTGVSDVYQTSVVVQDETFVHTATELFTDTTTDTAVSTSTAVVQTKVKKVVNEKKTSTNTVYHTSDHVEVKKETSTRKNTHINTHHSTDYTTETTRSTKVVPETQKVVDLVTKTRAVKVHAFSRVPDVATAVLTSTAKCFKTETKVHTDKKTEKTHETSIETIVVPRTTTQTFVATTTTDVPDYYTLTDAQVVKKTEVETSFSTDLRSTTETSHSTQTVTEVKTATETIKSKAFAHAKAFETEVVPTTIVINKVNKKTIGKPIEVRETKTKTSTFSAVETVASCEDEEFDETGNGNGKAYAYGHCGTDSACAQYKDKDLWAPRAFGLCNASIRSGNSVVTAKFLDTIAPFSRTSIKSNGQSSKKAA